MLPPAPPERDPNSLIEVPCGGTGGRAIEHFPIDDSDASLNEAARKRIRRENGEETTRERWHRLLIEEIARPLTALPVVSLVLLIATNVLLFDSWGLKEFVDVMIVAADVLAPVVLISIRAAEQPTLSRFVGSFLGWASYSLLAHAGLYFVLACFFGCLFGGF